jgi:hypothetical protein
MSMNNIGRRELIITGAAAGLGVLLAHRASAQNKEELTAPRAQDAGRLHQEGMQEISAALGTVPISTKEGLIRLVDYLVKKNVIDAKQADVLKSVITAVFDSVNADHLPDLNKMYDEVRRIYGTMEKQAEDVAVAIVSIAHDSVDYAKKHLKEIDAKTALEIVTSDIEGGLTGASTGSKFGKPGAIIGAIVAGLGSSAWEAYRKKRAPAVS